MNIPDYKTRKPLLQRIGVTDRYGELSGWAGGLVAVTIIAGIFGGVVGGIIAISNHTDHVSCLRLHEVTQLPTRYVRSGAVGECYIQVDGQWIPEDRWRLIEGE